MAKLAQEQEQTPSGSDGGRADAAVDLALDLSAAGRADPRAPLDDDLRQQPPAGRAAGRGDQRVPPGEEIALAHHGSVAREKRLEIEDRLKRGELPAIVATSSLELGIDMGAVDLVIQIEAPPSIASGMQRIGRAGHSVGEVSRGDPLPQVPRRPAGARRPRPSGWLEGRVEETAYPRNPLDVLAQQIVAIAASGTTAESDAVDAELYRLVRRAAPFADLPRSSFEGVLDMLSGRYPSDEFAELRPRMTWDRRRRDRARRAKGRKRIAVAQRRDDPRPRALRRLPRGDRG